MDDYSRTVILEGVGVIVQCVYGGGGFLLCLVASNSTSFDSCISLLGNVENLSVCGVQGATFCTVELFLHLS